jgi:DNA polymerase I-like protein with 3'-5' exonuclease and polymerase domains
MDALAPPKPAEPWNWGSWQQVLKVFQLIGVTLPDTKVETLAATPHPLAGLLHRHRAAAKRATTYGRGWLTLLDAGSRLHGDWRQMGARTGRMSAATPHLQNLPRLPGYRRAFVAPPGRVLLKADYSQIELRIAARVSGDRAMIQALADGEDLHVRTARLITGKPEVSKEERQAAKITNFSMIYGGSAEALRRKAKTDYGVELSPEDAERYREAFFRAYPGIARWHGHLLRQRRRQEAGREPAELRTLTGRRALIAPDLWHGARANYIVQGTGGDGIKQALALLWERRAQCPDALVVLVIHDEIVLEVPEGRETEAAAWLKGAMIDGMAPLLDPVPLGSIEVKTGKNWHDMTAVEDSTRG